MKSLTSEIKNLISEKSSFFTSQDVCFLSGASQAVCHAQQAVDLIRLFLKLTIQETDGTMNLYTKKNPISLWGFSVLELMIVLGIVAILGVLSYPTFSEVVAKNQTETTANQLHALLLKAQTESLRRGGFVQLQKFDGIPGSNPCIDNNDWSCGLRLMADADKNGTYELVLDEMSPPRGVALVNISPMSPAQADKILFDRWGNSANAPRLAFTQSKLNFQLATRAVCLESTGRVYTIKADYSNPSCS